MKREQKEVGQQNGFFGCWRALDKLMYTVGKEILCRMCGKEKEFDSPKLFTTTIEDEDNLQSEENEFDSWNLLPEQILFLSKISKKEFHRYCWYRVCIDSDAREKKDNPQCEESIYRGFFPEHFLASEATATSTRENEEPLIANLLPEHILFLSKISNKELYRYWWSHICIDKIDAPREKKDNLPSKESIDRVFFPERFLTTKANANANANANATATAATENKEPLIATYF